jgi:hypothetical protein
MVTIVKQLWCLEGNPDGYSLHLTVKDHDNFIAAYWRGKEYFYPEGAATPHSIDELSAEYIKVCKAQDGIRIYG